MKKYLMIILLICIGLESIIGAPTSNQKTPPSIETIFKGRCLEYQEVLRPELFPTGKRKDCTKLWDLFKSAFALKNACEVPVDNYEKYSSEADHDFDTFNRVMFWNGKVFPFVEEYTDYSGKYTIIRDILAVYMVKNIENWCGSKDGSGINYVTCPEWGQCADLAVSSFWQHMSKKWALKARGTVHVMLNASTETAFRETSSFGKYEVPYLDSARTPKMIAHLVRNLDETPKETCKTGTLLTLKKLLEKKNIVFECLEDERDIRFLQCVGQTERKDCKALH